MSLSEERLIEVLGRFSKFKVSVLGDIGIDRYTVGGVERISPEAPVPIVWVKNEYLKLGLAANVADNLVELEASANLVGVWGNDKDAVDLKRMMKGRGIQAEFCVTDGSRRTILKERITAENQQMLRVDYEDRHPFSEIIRSELSKSLKKSLKDADALIIEDYSKGLLNRALIQEGVEIARKKGIPVLVDPHLMTPLTWYKGASLLTPNKREAEALAQMRIFSESDLIEVGRIILSKTQAKSLIITLGKEGMAIFRKGSKKPVRIPTFAQEVYDVSGAGDTVIAVLSLCMAAGADLEEAAWISNLAAGVEVSKRGTATVTPKEIVQAFQTRMKP